MTCLSVLHLATAGQNGQLLGSDEEEIVLICLAVLNINTNQVCSVRYHFFPVLTCMVAFLKNLLGGR